MKSASQFFSFGHQKIFHSNELEDTLVRYSLFANKQLDIIATFF